MRKLINIPALSFNSGRGWVVLFIALLAGYACQRTAPESNQWGTDPTYSDSESATHPSPYFNPTRYPGSLILTPTPDLPRTLPLLRTEPQDYVVRPGDTLAQIADDFTISMDKLIEANQLTNPDLLHAGQSLLVPPPTPRSTAPGFKIIPDSELVYSPSCTDFDLTGFVNYHNGYLKGYKEEIDGVEHTGAQVVARIGREFSVNPRILLAVLEHQVGWVTQPQPDKATNFFTSNGQADYRLGLYQQLAWAANNLNRGYYLWRVNAIPGWLLADGSVVTANASINAGTAGVQHLLGKLLGYDEWVGAVNESGIFSIYSSLFGYPFDVSIEPLVPGDSAQPRMQLPFESGVTWSFTGGPHGGWGDGSGWAGVDFAPPGEALGCVPSDAWVAAVADGIVIRSADGVVVQDLSGDGFEQTGWTILYLHIESRDRVAAGSYLKAGERVGHPSCEGGFSSGTHIHLARRYNGEWIPADGAIPFILDDWVSKGTGVEYNGYLIRNGERVEAWYDRRQENQISR